ncbi:MAG: hypothetical protein ACEB74_11250 [Desulfovibrio aminophilus]
MDSANRHQAGATGFFRSATPRGAFLVRKKGQGWAGIAQGKYQEDLQYF